MTPRVSVVSTVYNGALYFDRAIPGILSQTFTDFEFILVDDGSSDGTLEALRQLEAREPRVRVFAPGRLGAATAYNFGVAQATGEYVARQDFDDRSYPERLRLQVDYLDAHLTVGAVGGSYVLVDERRGERYVRMPPTEPTAVRSALAKYVPIAHTLATFRRQAWSDVGGYPIVNNLIDLRFYLRLAKAGWQLGNVTEVLGEHYVHDASFFHQTLQYVDRQRDLARVQAQSVRELGLPPWMYLYSVARHAYAYVPPGFKRVLRRGMAGSRERDT